MEGMLDPNDDGKWLLEMTRPNRSKGAFGDVGPAVRRLRQAGAKWRELGRLAAWSRYEASCQTLRLVKEFGLLKEDSLEGLHELFLGAEPSGTEAGPKSWPLPEPLATSAHKQKEENPSRPIWTVRSGQAVAISPDSKTVAVAGSSGPVRLLDAATGIERVVCEGLKAHIYKIAFSPDGKWVAAAQINQWVTICHASSGKLVAKVKVSKEEVSGLVFSSKTGELIRSSWCKSIEVINPPTGQRTRTLQPAPEAHMVTSVAFSPDGSKLVAVWYSQDASQSNQCTVWSWPEGRELTRFAVNEQHVSEVAISHHGTVLAISFRSYHPRGGREGVHLVDASDGKILRTIPLSQPDSMLFTPNRELLVAPSGINSEDIRCSFVDPQTGRTLLRIPIAGGVCEMSISNDGRYLAAATAFAGAKVWNLTSLVAVAWD